MPRPAQRHHEKPGLEEFPDVNIGQQGTGAEIDLGGFARRKVQSKRDLGGDRRGQPPQKAMD